jgi:uncharacterized membrane protein
MAYPMEDFPGPLYVNGFAAGQVPGAGMYAAAGGGFQPVPNYDPPPGGGYPPPPQGPPPIPPTVGGGLTINSAAALSYLTFIPAVIFLVVEPYNRSPFVRFNAFQCIFLTVVDFVGSIAFMVAALLLGHVFFLFGMLVHVVSLVFYLGVFIFWLIAILKASKGEWYKIPLIGDLAMKQAQTGSL